MTAIPAPGGGVRIRMYQYGFGDCFLLTFRGRDDHPVHVLIDCGVHAQWRPLGADPGSLTGGRRLNRVVQHIRESTNDHVDVVVVTHEHADHLSGFLSAKAEFEKLSVGEVWMAWTEDPESKEARRLDKTRGMMMTQLKAMGLSLGASQTAFDNVSQVMGFFDIPLEGNGKGSGSLFGASSRDARDNAMALSSNRRFFHPHRAPHSVPGVDGVRVFVLGPPEDERLLQSARPTGTPGEVYESDDDAPESEPGDGPTGATERLDFTDAVDPLQPFAGNHRLPVEWVQANVDRRFDFYHEFYGFPAEEDEDPMAWRKIGSEIGVIAEDLALRLDSATNNTSLVLAFELSEGRVLLFPGDAQVGNWKSWHLRKWTEENGLPKGEVVTAADLLERTVLYKVAHHGSHNATLKEKGLELMTSRTHPHLAAMIPVDEQWAKRRRPHPWIMPYPPLWDDLVARTGGRILRADRAIDPAQPWGPFAPPTGPGENLDSDTFTYVDLVIPDEPDEPLRRDTPEPWLAAGKPGRDRERKGTGDGTRERRKATKRRARATRKRSR